jgi:hypothetical protein
MAFPTPVGANVVTAIARRFIMPEVVDNIYNSNPVFFRINKSNKRLVRGGYQIEVPLMYARFTAGGPYSGMDLLNVAPSDTIKNGAWGWRQQYVPVTVDGLTLIKTDSPEAIANFIRLYFAQAEMEMAENLAVGLWSDGSTDPKQIDGLEGAIDDGGALAAYAGYTRSVDTWWQSTDDSTSAAMTLPILQSFFGNVAEGGRSPSLWASRQEQYNRFWNLNVVSQTFPTEPGGRDEVMARAGFYNQTFNGVPWCVDSHVFDGPNASNSAIVSLNEDYIYWAVSPRADFYLEPFQTPTNQDAMTSKMLWAGNLILTNCQRQGKLSAILS